MSTTKVAVSARSMAALQRAQAQFEQARAALQFVCSTLIDAYELPGPITGFNADEGVVLCNDESDEDEKPALHLED